MLKKNPFNVLSRVNMDKMAKVKQKISLEMSPAC